MQKAGTTFHSFLFFIALLLLSTVSRAQQNSFQTTTNPLTPKHNDSTSKTNTNKWRDEQTVISYKKFGSQIKLHPDTSLHTFHERMFTQEWNYDLGNSGSPIKNLLFTPEYRVDPSLGYHVFDAYRFDVDSARFYNTTRPYTSFGYQLGSKAEQMAQVLHTQNIKPNWNVAVQYRKINSPGYYKIQRTNHDFGNLTTNYQSKNQHYELKGVFVYNHVQNDENGGIATDSFLTNSSFTDRKTIPVLFQNDVYSTTRSAVTTFNRDFSFLIVHGYSFGKTDTLYNADSTHYSFRLHPKFGITHRFQLGSEKYQYKDVRPDSLRYVDFFNQGFYDKDSVFTQQKWFFITNELLLNGFLGKTNRQMVFNLGVGNRFDRFRTQDGIDGDRNDQISNYLTGEIKKEAFTEQQWFYTANAKFFFTGTAAGNFMLHADGGKEISKQIGALTVGFEQRLGNAPYNYTIYQNQYFLETKSYNKESTTQIFAKVANEPLKLSIGFNNYVISNYIYLNQQQQFDQYATPFNISQLSLKKVFKLGIWVLDNELVYQQKTGNAPVNIPTLLGKNQLSIETYLFNNALKVATGIDLRWHTSYDPSGYSSLFNRFYYQNSYHVINAPATSLFFNFKIKNFRAYVMGDQLQALFTKNIISTAGYPSPNAMIRFGFDWVMIN